MKQGFSLLAWAGITALLSSPAMAKPSSYHIDLWADNWLKAYINGEELVEDSTPITTERSFNREHAQFSVEGDFVIAFELKDFKQDDTGLEYIGSWHQQMGDGGFIAQIMEQERGQVVAVSDRHMRCLVIHRAPLDERCANESSPSAGKGPCQFETIAKPHGWTQPHFDDQHWPAAVEYSKEQVRPKGGYDEVKWSPAAKLIWSSSLTQDNTLLCRLNVTP